MHHGKAQHLVNTAIGVAVGVAVYTAIIALFPMINPAQLQPFGQPPQPGH